MTIARKIALAVAVIVILCIGTMAWLTNANLQRGFIAYLNDMQAQDLDQVSQLLAERYRREGGFEWLRHRPRAMKEVLDQMAPQLQMEPDAPGERRREREGRGVYGPPDRQGPRDGPPDDPEGRGPPRDEGRSAYGPPRRGDNGRPPPPRRDEAPRPPRPRELQDPMAFAARLTVKDEYGESVMGPRNPPAGIERPIMVDGRKVGTVQLLLLRQASGQSATAANFLRTQTRDILLLSGVLLLVAMGLAVGLARHMLRPVTALHGVTARLARGELAARAPVLSRDELGELALHVNAMAQELERNETQRRQMLADVSHELRTPLTVIRGEIEALIDGVRKADQQALESLHSEVLRLAKLVDDLHQLALADTGDLHFDMHEVELQSVLSPLLERCRPRAAAAGLALRWELPPQPVTVNGDARRLEQVVVNLLENSIRYTDRGGVIVLALRVRHDGRQLQAEITVDDSAPGVPAGAHARLFERLYRVDQARTRERGGSGLGLAICKAMVEAHGGAIAALPSEHGGVRIRITLPVITGASNQ
ncbi:HAMP domain-containing protein [Duganella ginsengisoli]|uniref:histidine kinase n=1 Tax=Pseudoduganella ginsengisoli TaxID=1462440 RepID=A0A6L6PXY1_9BURK|nr:HAMP domain-containing protein [Pseudoduganella ginsengisoli]